VEDLIYVIVKHISELACIGILETRPTSFSRWQTKCYAKIVDNICKAGALRSRLPMGTIQLEHGMAKYIANGHIYYVKQHFTPSLLPTDPRHARKFIVPETFFSYGPIEKIVSLLGLGRVNVVSVKLAHEIDLSPEETDQLKSLVGPEFYFSRAAYQYTKDTLPLKDAETALGFQVVFDTLVRNWDDGDRNIWIVSDIPVWFDFGASLDPRCQNIYRFLLKLQETAEAGRVSSIKRYFQNYSRRRGRILRQAINVLKNISLSEIRAIVQVAEDEFAGFFAEYLAKNISQISEDVDIIRGAFLSQEAGTDNLLGFEPMPRDTFWRQIK